MLKLEPSINAQVRRGGAVAGSRRVRCGQTRAGGGTDPGEEAPSVSADDRTACQGPRRKATENPSETIKAVGEKPTGLDV